MDFELKPARTPEQIDAARRLFQGLADWYWMDHQVDLTFQGFADELRELPGKYAPPEGDLIVACLPSGEAVGCIAVRPFRDRTCEVKRLYVRPDVRGAG